MRVRYSWMAVASVTAVLLGGCPPRTSEDEPDDMLAVVAGLTQAGVSAPVSPPELSGSTTVSGTVWTGEYQLLDLGLCAPGDEWVIADATRQTRRAFLVVLFDADYTLLRREIVSGDSLVAHITRTASPALHVGVAPFSSGEGGDFALEISRWPGAVIPAPGPQVMWLNFGGAGEVRVHGRPPISFSHFDPAALGESYAGADESIKAAIVQTIRDDYAPYNVTVLTSDEGPPPAGPYATVHFGGRDDRLLGLADNVDQYNADPWQTAVIYVEGFADYEVMELSDEEMGQMIGNVASHEFGHLLGLFHTQVPSDLMDTTGSAWDLAGAQHLSRARLEATVFPFGYENSPARLTEIVGSAPGAGEPSLAKPTQPAKMLRKAAIRALAREELRGRCGTCLHLDE